MQQQPTLARDDDPTRFLRGDDHDYARATAPRAFRFPADHGAHREYRSEWWYFTGHLQDDHARRYGFQITIFRFEIAPAPLAGDSAWSQPRVLLGHFALTDPDAKPRQRFLTSTRLARAHPAIAGIEDDPLHIRLDDWSVTRAPGATERWSLEAHGQAATLTLELEARSAIVLQGDDGLSRKGGTRGNASYYYSIPRLAAGGHLQLDDTTHAVRGSAWLDREWSTSALERGQRGWDWFALQFDDGANLMFYRLRTAAGATDRHSAGSYVTPTGEVVRLAATDVEARPLTWWRSPRSGRRYPVRWRLKIVPLERTVVVTPLQNDQEWPPPLRYWEGAVDVEGSARGRGYVELTGY